jgi:hypothetical protein
MENTFRWSYVTTMTELGQKHDAGKPRWELLPWREVGQVVDVLTQGALKYEVDNWKHVEPLRERYTGALMRHFTAWAQGEKKDHESGLPHLAHACCCLLFLMWEDNQKNQEES